LSEALQESANRKDSASYAEKKSAVKKVLGILFDIFTVLVVFFVIFLLVIMFQLKGITSEGVSVAGFRMFIVQTMSMDPVYPTGSVVVTKRVPPADIKEGDVISFLASYSGSVVTHRVVEAFDLGDGRYGFVTKGDANPSNDSGLVGGQAVLGVVVLGIPNLGLLLGKLRSVWGLVLLVILPSSLVIIGEAVKLSRLLREEKAKSVEAAGGFENAEEPAADESDEASAEAEADGVDVHARLGAEEARTVEEAEMRPISEKEGALQDGENQ
jgi:signal peptidase